MHTYIVIDDEPVIRKGTIKKLEDLHAIAECIGQAGNGSDGLKLIETVNPEIVITDMNMPEMDGIDFLKTLRERYLNKQIIVISGYKDFEYAKEAIESKAISYILKPFDRQSIQNAMRTAIHNIESSTDIQDNIVQSKNQKEAAELNLDLNLITNLIMGYYTCDEPEFVSDKLLSSSRMHSAVLMTLYSDKVLNGDFLNDFINAEKQDIEGIYIRHPHADHIGFFVIFIADVMRNKYADICGSLTKKLLSYNNSDGLGISIGISRIKKSVGQMNEAYKETLDALNSKYLSDESKAYFYQIMPKKARPLVWNGLDELLFRMESGETDKVDKLINELFCFFKNQTDITLMDAKIYSMDVIQQAKNILANYLETSISDEVSQSIQSIFNQIFDLEELQAYLSKFFSNVSGKLTNKNIYSSDDPIVKVKAYVMENYQKNITLDLISSFFYINSSYFSHLFKEKTGENFVDYLNGVRIGQAKLLLKNSDQKMYRIAKAVGYDNVKYFFRIFKKITGLSPEAYRSSETVDHG